MSALYFSWHFLSQVVIYAYSSLHRVGLSAWVDDLSDFAAYKGIMQKITKQSMDFGISF